MKVSSKRNVYQASRPGTLAYQLVFNATAPGTGLVRVRMTDVADDIHDDLQISYSDDNGDTWPRALPVQLSKKTPDGTLRQSFTDFYVDPVNGRQIIFTLEGLLKDDGAFDGLASYYIRYRTNESGSLTALVDEPIVQAGYTSQHPYPGQWPGHNAMMNPGGHSVVRLPDGKLLMAMPRTILAPDGKWYNPAGTYGYFEIITFFGRWSETRHGAIDWRAGPVIGIDPAISPRGIFEPTIAVMPDGRLLMIARGSNGGETDPSHQIASHKWKCVSSDGGATWTDPEPWTYSDGGAFYSSSSISTFVEHSNGNLYWIGHVSAENCENNLPRDRLFIGRVDPVTLGLVRDSVFLIDQREPGEPQVQISCMISACEDRQSKEIVVHAPRFMQQSETQWGGDSYEYRINVE